MRTKAAIRWTIRFGISALFLLTGAGQAAGQHEGHEGRDPIGWVPREILERPLPLRRGIGNLHEPVTTSAPQAQAFYDQGLCYLHSYVWIEAARSFHQALRLDPELAMAYAGLSEVYLALQDRPAARAALEKAQSLSAKAPEPERRRIEILARQLDFLENSGDVQKYIAYRKAINDALAASPGDATLWILRGFADERTPLGHGQGGGVDSIAFYETALGLSPDNFAAHHYLVHSFENLGRTQEALEHAEAYVRLAPAIPHAHHMSGHNLRRAGLVVEAIQEFRKADELEDEYYRSERIPAEYDWHHAHNLSLLAMCYQSLGQIKQAEQLLRQAFLLPAHNDLAEFNRREWPEFLLDRGRAPEALEESQSLVRTQWAMGRFAGHTLAGRALVTLNRMSEARDELGLAEKETEQLPVGALQSLPYAGALRAEILLRDGKRAQGESLMKQIEDNIRSLPGPDAWSQALFQLESIARIAREIGDWELAEYTSRAMIEHDPNYAGGHYALALVAEHQGVASTAHQEFAAAEKLWSKADPDLPELQRARASRSTEH